MSRTVTQSLAADLVAILTDSNNSPVTGLTFADVTVQLRKEGAAIFTTKVITAPDFVEIGSGVYEIQFTAAELDTLGSFVYKVTGATISQYVEIVDVVAAGEALTSTSVDTCVISGHVFDIAGNPIANATISARLVGGPSVLGATGLGDTLVHARTSSNGEFFLELARQSYVHITIPKMGYSRQLVVPNAASADLFTGIP